MFGFLPEALEVGGREIPINSDFRNVLRIFEAFEDPALTNQEKAYICICRLYAEPVEIRFMEEAIRKAYWFCNGGDMPKSKPEAKVLDWKQDEHIMMPAVSRTMGVTDVRSLPYLHWWSFLGAFGETGEGLFTEVLHIRNKLAHGKKLDKTEKEFLKRNRYLIKFRSQEDDTALAETEEFLKTLI